ncbi:MFS transporter [Gluconacetobacter azotocaptans]|uniref:MFS transporter n=1 Tax=Gluconacetobacter azotocaptans TaxID=142834 RepID=A0A7W4JRH6_9PROT|nr:MFS transporter [Gluconacetobacter azotocaptans]MBB2189566.1 MFS transporter [Gluconacetobacter azotocaptans]MBM9403539.1 MFS transporter [Gluconacetobacter azotocaptans]GBQ33661.1 major facilitator superfamily transporter [Gluconacetobacter azotocaptans DSM 13594]
MNMPPPVPPPSGLVIRLIACAAGMVVANIYYAQPLIALIGPDIGLPAAWQGSVVMLTQLGYGFGMIGLVSLADIVENRRLVLVSLACLCVALLGSALASSAVVFLAMAFVVGVFATATQVLVPLASHLSAERDRGRVVGTVMGGLIGGIMLARPFSSILAAHAGWHAVFVVSCGMMLVLMVALARKLPRRQPVHDGLTYAHILGSLGGLLAHTPLLRRRAFYQGAAFAAFNMFWTAVPLLLAGPSFRLGQTGIALFALAGAGGALAAPVAGRLADRGLTDRATTGAMLMIAGAFAATGLALAWQSLLLLALAAIVLDAGVQTNQVVSMRAIYMLRPEVRGRLNALFMTIVFLSGAAGSVSAAALFHGAGWADVAVAGGGLAMVALARQIIAGETFRR